MGIMILCPTGHALTGATMDVRKVVSFSLHNPSPYIASYSA